MKTRRLLLGLLLVNLVVMAGCHGQRTTPPAERVVLPPPPVAPVPPGPPEKRPKDPYVVIPQPPDKPILPPQEEQALVCTAKLDLLRVLICSDETVHLSDTAYKSDECKQKVVEHFSDIGYRVVDGAFPGYNASGGTLKGIANDIDVDLFVLLYAKTTLRDKFGDFYLFQADGRGRVAQIVGNELVTATSANVRGKRGLSEGEAAQSALQACGEEIGQKLSYEILRKSSSGILVRELTIDGLGRASQADYIRVGLEKKPGVYSVTLKRWDSTNKRAVFLIRLDASVKENLAAYLEDIEKVRLRVTEFQKTELKSREKGPLEVF